MAGIPFLAFITCESIGPSLLFPVSESAYNVTKSGPSKHAVSKPPKPLPCISEDK
jgi:hypothetical protein